MLQYILIYVGPLPFHVTFVGFTQGVQAACNLFGVVLCYVSVHSLNQWGMGVRVVSSFSTMMYSTAVNILA